jgi:hypothetical protein
MIEHAAPTESWLILLHGANIPATENAICVIEGKVSRHAPRSQSQTATDRHEARMQMILDFVEDNPGREFINADLLSVLPIGPSRLNEVMFSLRLTNKIGWRKDGHSFVYFHKEI